MIRVFRSSRPTRVLAYSGALLLAVFAVSAIFERLVEVRLMPENFLLEFGIFAALWFVIDHIAGRLLSVSFLSALFERRHMFAHVSSFVAALAIAGFSFQFGSFSAEIAAFALLWAFFDHLLGKVVA
ncbi:MAG: hypothetical protein WB615_01570 [Candidatus Tumulicola sp.]